MTTLAERLTAAGYQCHQAGKWDPAESMKTFVGEPGLPLDQLLAR